MEVHLAKLEKKSCFVYHNYEIKREMMTVLIMTQKVTIIVIIFTFISQF